MTELRGELRLRRPDEGWLAVALVAGMVLILAWAIDDPGWVNGRDDLTDILPWCALLGAAFGFLGPKLGWNRWTTHLVGIAFAALLVPVLAGWTEAPGTGIGEAFRTTASGSVGAYLDIAWRGLRFTSQEVHYTLTLGLGTWATAQFMAYAVFGHHRPLNAVVVGALVLLGNMSLTFRDQLPHLVLFTAASLFLLITMHTFDERTTWLRRRIGDPATVSGLYLRGGTVFIVGALLGSLVLTQQAASAPLAGAWRNVDRQLIEIGETIGRWFPVAGDLRSGGGVAFGNSVRVTGRWFGDQGVAFVATVPSGERDLYWRAATYDSYRLDGWEQTGTRDAPVPAHEPLLAASAEDPIPDATREVTVSVQVDGYLDSLLLSPAAPTAVDADARVTLTGDRGWFTSVETGSRAYTVTARVLNVGEAGVSANLLRSASEDYPADVTAHYTAVPDGAIGPDAADLLERIRAKAKSDDPYDLADAAAAYLRDSANFTYDADIRDIPCDSQSLVECFARNARGYCIQYASTMAILLRAANPDNPIPTRLVQGFLPGDVRSGQQVVTNDRAHAWVEVFFPGYGWIPFDPTGGGVGRASEIPEGPPVTSPTAPPATSSPGDGRAEPSGRGDDFEPDGGGAIPTPIDRGGDRLPLVAITVLLALIVLGVAFAAWLRGPRGELNADTAWRSLSGGAARMGFAPRPTQTVYEYASALGDLVPVARRDLRTVADAKVETTYARVRLEGDRLQALREATIRLRLSLLRLLLRRGRRRTGRRP